MTRTFPLAASMSENASFDADFERRKLVLSRSYGDYLLATRWNDGDPRYAFNYEMLRVTDTFLYYAGVSEDLLGADGSVLTGLIPTLLVASPIPASDLNYWTSANALNADVASTARRSAVLSYEAAVAAANEAFVAAYGAVVSDAIDAELDSGRGELVASVDAFATLETSILAAAETAEASWRDAVREAEVGTSVEKYRKASVLAGLTYARDASAAFGTFQVGIREDRLASTSETDARYAAYLADVDWAEQTKSLRDQYCVKLRSSLHSLNTSLAQYVRVYDKRFIAHDLDTTRVEFIADKKFILASQKAEGVYELARYDAQAANLRAYCAASLAELSANTSTERALAATRADVYAQAFAEIVAEFNEFDGGRFQGDPTRIVLKDRDDAGAFDFDGLDALAERVAHARGAATAADRALQAENEATASDARAANKALFDAALREADEALASSLRASETDASLSIFGAAATRRRYLDARDAFTAERTPRELNDYATIVRNKMKTIGATLDGYAKIFAYNQERIDLYGGTVSGDVFSNSTFDYEICFVAGTPVVMADGRVQPIETIQPGDEVLAADHLLPEGKPRAARVVRFFDNGEKPVVRLRFDGFELVCTPEHPFYIVGKGWTRASELAVGDLALNASGERVAFLGREAVDGTRRVYNIEVEDAHTYFVGDGGGVLAHNVCWLCSDSGRIAVNNAKYCGMSFVTTNNATEIDCPCVCHLEKTDYLLETWDDANRKIGTYAELARFTDEQKSEANSILSGIRNSVMNTRSSLAYLPFRLSKGLRNTDYSKVTESEKIHGARGYCVRWCEMVMHDVADKFDVTRYDGNYGFLIKCKESDMCFGLIPIIATYKGPVPLYSHHVILAVEIVVEQPEAKRTGSINTDVAEYLGAFFLDNGLYGSHKDGREHIIKHWIYRELPVSWRNVWLPFGNVFNREKNAK